MTVIKWLGTTAVALAIGTGAVVAQSQRDMPQKGDDSPRAQSPKEADRPAAAEQRPSDRAKDRAAQPEPKAGAKEPQRAEDKSAPERRQAQEPSQTRDSKQPAKQTQEQPGRGERPPASTAQQGQDTQKGREAKQPTDQRQQQTRDQQQKQDTQARDAKQPADTRQQTQQQQMAPDRSGQAAQPSGARPADTAQGRQQPAAGQATDQTTQRGQTASTQVNEQQRTQIIEKLRSDRTAARTTQNLNVQVNIGQPLPPRVRPRVLPPDIVRIAPQYRGYEYTIVEDEIVIVEPRSRRVVDVLSERGPARAAASVGVGGGRMGMVMTQEQRETFRQVARRSTTGSTSPSGSVVDANCLTLQAVPEELVRANPQLESYRYLAIGEQFVLIDPREQKVVEVVD
jgi:Protein of unknown function (DUF1236)